MARSQPGDARADADAPGDGAAAPASDARVESISAVTLATTDMARAVHFYEALGYRRLSGGAEASFTSFAVGESYINVVVRGDAPPLPWWGRLIFYVSDVDAFYERALGGGLSPQFAPRDAEWGERYFHLTDPDGHELSFARPLRGARGRDR